ncbi:MAG TPA: galactose-1-phosphate uridylyltransferase [Pyrinomonadaceae bacterium]
MQIFKDNPSPINTRMTWEERWHPLRQEWVIVAAHRQERPWEGETVQRPAAKLPDYDPGCYLCPGNSRVSGQTNPNYSGVFAFDNDHPCVGSEAPEKLKQPIGFYRNRPARGIARVVCYTPRHNLTLAELNVSEIRDLLRAWQEQYVELSSNAEIQDILIFENKGEAVGVSNPHPHCQIYATNFVFKTMETETAVSHRHLEDTGRILFQDIIRAEEEDGRRIICNNNSSIAFLPYFARYAYEVFVAPKESHANIATLNLAELTDFASALKTVLVKLDNLWRISFPYVLTLHQSIRASRGFHFHVEIHPPLRRPNLLKYLAGPEIGGGNFLSDTAPEEKAAELQQLPEIHYKQIEQTGQG